MYVLDTDIVRGMMERHCYVSNTYKDDVKNASKLEQQYTLPSGQVTHLGRERFESTEIFFNHKITG